MFGVSLFAPFGPGGVGRPGSPPDISQIAARRVDHIEQRVESGKLDPEKLDQRLQARFGEAAQGIVGEDGSVDFDRLEKLIVETRSEKLQDRLTARFGERADGIVSPDGSVDAERLRELFAEHRLGEIIDRLKEKLGDDLDSVIGEDGEIDFAALKELIGELADFARSVAGAGDRAEPAEDTEAAAAVFEQDESATASDSETAAHAEQVDSGETTGHSASEQLALLREMLFEARLERQFGDDLPGIFGKDGEIDFDALRQLFDENGPGRPDGRSGPQHSPYPGRPIPPSPFFELRA